MIKIGNNDTKLYLGNNEIEKVYLGTSQVYEEEEPTPVPYSGQYLTIESLEDGNNTISFTMGDKMTTAITTAVTSVSVSTDDGVTWTSMENIGAGASLSVTLVAGEKAIWKGEAVRYAVTNDAANKDRQTRFSSTGQFKVYGNIMSLISGDTFEDAETLTGINTFCALFKECTGLTSAENLILPATTLAQQCYRSMFNGCTSLTTAPVLPATTLITYCYSFMFNGCTSLTTAPQLPATTLANNCYNTMFNGCTSLTTAPELPATTLASYCYGNMFNGCTSLNYIKCLATDISATNCTSTWVDGVASTGTFVKASLMQIDWQCGDSGIPEGWTVEDENGNPETNPCDDQE